MAEPQLLAAAASEGCGETQIDAHKGAIAGNQRGVVKQVLYTLGDFYPHHHKPRARSRRRECHGPAAPA